MKLAPWAGHQTPRAARLAVGDSEPHPAISADTGSCPLLSSGTQVAPVPAPCPAMATCREPMHPSAPQCVSSINIANLPTSGWAGSRLGPQVPTRLLRENTPAPILHGWPGGHASRPHSPLVHRQLRRKEAKVGDLALSPKARPGAAVPPDLAVVVNRCPTQSNSSHPHHT